MNKRERADRAMRALVTYKLTEWDDPTDITPEEVQEAISALLCDLRHLVDTLLVEQVKETLWQELVERGDGHYHTESEEH